MIATLVLLWMMVAFMVGVIIGELADQHDQARESADMAEAERFSLDMAAAKAHADSVLEIPVGRIARA